MDRAPAASQEGAPRADEAAGGHDGWAPHAASLLSTPPAIASHHRHAAASTAQQAGAPERSRDSSPGARKCNCRNSRCLKLYCECFASGDYCDNCHCVDCLNSPAHEMDRKMAIDTALERNPDAFKPKIKAVVQQSARHSRGCHCKKSNCLKRYCECYQARIECTELCKCVDCRNFSDNPERKALMVLASMAGETMDAPSEAGAAGDDAPGAAMATEADALPGAPYARGLERATAPAADGWSSPRDSIGRAARRPLMSPRSLAREPPFAAIISGATVQDLSARLVAAAGPGNVHEAVLRRDIEGSVPRRFSAGGSPRAPQDRGAASPRVHPSSAPLQLNAEEEPELRCTESSRDLLTAGVAGEGPPLSDAEPRSEAFAARAHAVLADFSDCLRSIVQTSHRIQMQQRARGSS